MTQIKILNAVAQIIYDKKGFNILALDIEGISTLYNYLIIAEGTVERHVQGLSREIIHKLEESGFPVFHVEGSKIGDWIVIDAGELVIHLFISDLREKYSLEKLWQKGQIIDLNIKTKVDL